MTHYEIDIKINVQFDGTAAQAREFYKDVVLDFEGTKHFTESVEINSIEPHCPANHPSNSRWTGETLKYSK